MRTINIRLKKSGYAIVIGKNIRSRLGHFLKKAGCAGSAIIITNPAIKKLWGKEVNSILKKSGVEAVFTEIADTEKSKSIQTCLKLLDKISRFARARRIFVIAFGGGVVGDVGGFTASIYKRGVPYVQLPTTLLAQADSAIGGKVAIDLESGKNLAGAFYQPRIVVSDTAFLSTLSRRQVSNGLAEIIKCAVIKDLALFKFLEENLGKVMRLDMNAIEHIIVAADRIKARVVEADEFDRLGIRMVLNYGHTIGHAIEAASGYSKRLTHGEAISMGMAAANFISGELGLLPAAASKRISALLERAGLPTSAKGVNPRKIYEAHLHDKKFTGKKNRFVLAAGVGRTKIVEGVAEKLVKAAIDKICA